MAQKQKTHLYYFTASFPYGLGETWKSNELKYLVEYIDRITVVPYSYGGNTIAPKPVPAGVQVATPLFESDQLPVSLPAIFKLLDGHVFYYGKEFFAKRVFLSKRKLYTWLNASLQIKRLLAHPFVQQVIREADKHTCLYFFWGKGSCDFLPFADKSRFGKIMVRFHRYDLFEDESGGYIPYRRQLLQSMTLAAPSSNNGYAHLHGLYPDVKTHMRVVRIGVLSEGVVGRSTDGVLRIMSCSYVVPVKRVHIIAQALKTLSMPIEWTHVGDGPLMNELRDIVKDLPGNVKVHFPGMIDTLRLIDFYKTQQIDLFINVSSSEGVPMSVMECLSLSIPVFATAVGGTGEIIDAAVGGSFPKDLSPAQLASAIKAFYEKSDVEKDSIRKAAFARYKERCDAEQLTRELGKFLIS